MSITEFTCLNTLQDIYENLIGTIEEENINYTFEDFFNDVMTLEEDLEAIPPFQEEYYRVLNGGSPSLDFNEAYDLGLENFENLYWRIENDIDTTPPAYEEITTPPPYNMIPPPPY